MTTPRRPHLLGIDDGPFDKHDDLAAGRSVPLVAVMMEGGDRVEAVATESFPVDGDDVTAFLSTWVAGLRCRPLLHGVLLGGVTLAGLAVVDPERLALELALPVLVVNRREPRNVPLRGALASAGLGDRAELLDRVPPSRPVDGLWLSAAGIEGDRAAALVRSAGGKSTLPEPLRIAHLVAAAIARGESRGRV